MKNLTLLSFFLAIASSSILPFDTFPLQAGRTGSLRGTLQQKYLLKNSISSQSWQQCWLPCRQDVGPASGRNPARLRLCRQMTLGVQESKIMRRPRLAPAGGAAIACRWYSPVRDSGIHLNCFVDVLAHFGWIDRVIMLVQRRACVIEQIVQLHIPIAG